MHPEEIKAALRMAGWTQAMLAADLTAARSSINNVIYGSIRSQRIQTRISEIIGRSIREIWPLQVPLRRTRAQMEAARLARMSKQAQEERRAA